MSTDKPKPEKRKPGPEAERLKLDMDWEDAAKKIIGKKKPAEGWPDPPDNTDGNEKDQP